MNNSITLGIIYKNEEMAKNNSAAIVYFEDAIKKNNDNVVMYNLAHLHIYEQPFKNSLSIDIELLIKSHNENFFYASILLCLAVIIKFGYDINDIKEGIDHYTVKTEALTYRISNLIKYYKLDDVSVFAEFFESYRNIDFLYDLSQRSSLSNTKNVNNCNSESTLHEISSLFYERFEIDL